MRISLALQLGVLAFANFTVGTGAFAITGILPGIASGLGIGTAQAGQAAAAFSIAFAVGAPLLAGLTSRMRRKTLLCAGLLVFIAGSLVAGLADGFGWLLFGRVVGGLGASLVTPHAAVVASLLAGKQRQGQAVALVLLGYAAATVAGIPSGVWIGSVFGWRAALLVLVVLGAVSLAAVLALIPPSAPTPAIGPRDWLRLLRNPGVSSVIAVTVLQVLGQSMVLTYLALLLAQLSHAGTGAVGALILVYGAGCVLGLVLASRAIDRRGPAFVVSASLGLMAVAMAAWLGAAPHGPLIAACLLAWGLGSFAINSAQQTRLIALFPALATASVPLNSSASFAAQSLGAVLGGIAIETQGVRALPPLAAVVLLAALAVALRSARR